MSCTYSFEKLYCWFLNNMNCTYSAYVITKSINIRPSSKIEEKVNNKNCISQKCIDIHNCTVVDW
jgi:hypothetical protein